MLAKIRNQIRKIMKTADVSECTVVRTRAFISFSHDVLMGKDSSVTLSNDVVLNIRYNSIQLNCKIFVIN